MVPVQSGGGQERGIRSGTVPTPLAVGLGAACDLALHEMDVSPMYTAFTQFTQNYISGIGDCLRAGKLSHYVTSQPGQLSLSSLRSR